MFVDEAQICVRGGDGGAGCVSFLREAMRPRGGPDGGDGGDGGDVILVVDPSVATLMRFKSRIHWKASSGTHGSGKRKHGRTGSDLRIPVAPGTTVRTPQGALIADLVAPGDACVVAAGGRGGRGNARFLTNSRRAPSFAEQGELGEELWIRLDLRLLADVALVGYPNAGKSTLISSITAAKPKVADYPFTTLTPHLGVVAADGIDFTVADVPGLIEGAADGRGLGHQFLRHVERSSVLCILLDPLNCEVSVSKQMDVLIEELRRHSPELTKRPRVVVITKADALSPGFIVPAGLQDAMLVSAVSRSGLDKLLHALSAEVRCVRAKASEVVGLVVHRPSVKGFTVEATDDGWVVEGPDVRRSVALSDLTDPQALAYLQDRLRGLGVFEALEDAGCRDDDIVRIGEFEFDYAAESGEAERGRRRRKR